MEWISVTEQFPKPNESVLTYTPYSDMHYELQRIITFGGVAGGFPSGVTHWMPLPEPPKQDK